MATYWQGAVGENNGYWQASDGLNLYVAAYTSPGKVIKIRKSDYTTIAEWTGAAGENNCRTVMYDGTYIYAYIQVDPAYVVKINPVTMLEVSRWTSVAGQGNGYQAWYYGGFIYVHGIATPGKVFKIDTTTMATVATWTGAAGQNTIAGLFHNGTWLFIGIEGSPAQVVKVNPVTMLTDSTWVGTGGVENDTYNVVALGANVYASLGMLPAKVIQIDIATMTKIGTYTAAAGKIYGYALTTDGTYIYQGCYDNPGTVTKIDPATMNAVLTWTGVPIGASAKDQSFEAGDDNNGAHYGVNWWKQSFTPAGSRKINSVYLFGGKYGTTPGTITVSIKACDGAHKPTGPDLCVGTYDGNSLPNYLTPVFFQVNLGAGAYINRDTEYAIVARALTGTATDFFVWRWKSTGGYTGGEFGKSLDSGATWTEYAAYDALFQVWDQNVQANVHNLIWNSHYLYASHGTVPAIDTRLNVATMTPSEILYPTSGSNASKLMAMGAI